jgi:hypothetical protein
MVFSKDESGGAPAAEPWQSRRIVPGRRCKRKGDTGAGFGCCGSGGRACQKKSKFAISEKRRVRQIWHSGSERMPDENENSRVGLGSVTDWEARGKS